MIWHSKLVILYFICRLKMINKIRKYYPSKILLFGEYTIIDGSAALAVPFDKFKSKWNYNPKKINSIFKPFVQYLVNIDWEKNNTVFYIDKLKDDIEKGLYFDSNIPVGYGAGSSGSLSAALFDKYFENNNLNIRQLKNVLSLIEGFFHGVSSGMDPLVSYLNQGIKTLDKNKFEIIKNIDFELDNFVFYLLDSNKARNTKKYVDIYHREIKSKASKDKILLKMITLNDKIISAFLSKDELSVFSGFSQLSKLQYQYFGKMIIPTLQNIWKKSLNSTDFSIKLCGAGGGGFYLLLAKKDVDIKIHFENFELIQL